MNPNLNRYRLEVRYPDGPGPEHLQMLLRRDDLAALETSFSPEEKAVLEEADRDLLRNSRAFATELDSCIDLAERRREEDISPERWWWYLDVLAHLPLPTSPDVATETARAAAS